MKTITQKEIAQKLGISQMTVSRILNNRPCVKADLRETVLRLAERSGYVKNRIASSFVSGKTKLIGFLIPNITSSYFPELTDIVGEEANKNGYNMILAYSGENYDKTVNEIKVFMELRVDGIVITPPATSVRKDIYYRLQKSGIPFIFIDRYLTDFKCSYVVTDNVKGANMAVKHLISLGHRKIAHLRGPRYASSSSDIFKGYKKALQESHIPYDPKYVTGNSFEQEETYRSTQLLLKEREFPTAIFAVTDEAAIGVMRALGEKGLHVPEHVAVVGYGNVRGSSFLRAPLTTVQENTREIATNAFALLFHAIENRKKTVKRVEIQPKLILRESCGRHLKSQYLKLKRR